MSTREAIEAHARRGEKLLAIKFYRELTGEGLAESKRAVEAFIAAGRWGEGTPFASAAASVQVSAAASPSVDLAALSLLVVRGEKIAAIKALREMTGWGLAVAKAAVDVYCERRVWGAEVLERAGVAPGEMPVVVPLEALAQAGAFARAGEKIAAIKALRRVVEIGLKEAKNAVERFVADGVWPRAVLEAPLARADEAGSTGAAAVSAGSTTSTRASSASASPASASPASARPGPGTGASSGGRPGASQAATRPALTPAAAEAAAALVKRIGGGSVDAIHEVEKDFARGYLAIRGERAYFLTRRFDRWEVEREYGRHEGVSAEVRASLSRVELRLRKSFVYDSIHGLDEDTARAIGRLLDERFEE